MKLFKEIISGSALFICISSALAAPEFTKTLSKNGLDEIGIVQALPAGELSSSNISPYTKSIKSLFGKKDDDSQWLNKAYFHIKEKCSTLPDMPKTLDELNTGFRIFLSSLAEDTAANSGIIGMADMTGKKSSSVEILQYAQYGERSCKTDYGVYPVNFGVGVQANLHVKKIDSSLTTSGIPTLAASVQLGKSEVTLSITTLGLTGKKVQEALPNFKDGLDSFNVTNYGKVTSTVDQVRILSYDENTTVTPQLIIPEQVIQAIATEMKQRGA
jgi:hypothetical protein